MIRYFPARIRWEPDHYNNFVCQLLKICFIVIVVEIGDEYAFNIRTLRFE
jgi:hypothetical protein